MREERGGGEVRVRLQPPVAGGNPHYSGEERRGGDWLVAGVVTAKVWVCVRRCVLPSAELEHGRNWYII